MLTNLEGLINSLLSLHGTKAYNGEITTTTGYVALATAETMAKNVYISNTSGGVLLVRTNGVDLRIPDNSIFPVVHVSNLQNVSVKRLDSAAGTVISFRYEV